ncbi:MAG: 3-hydroxyacyl-CoA dehydrogenase NAD-binding domain-containing protein, partial [Anaerolineales bacterium]
MTTKDKLIQKLQDKTAKIGILGMGYVGMPLAVVFAEKGFNVIGIDPDQRKVDTFKKGVSYIQDVPSETVQRLHKAGKLDMTTDFAALADVDAVSICVPTPLRKTGDPDMSFVVSATEELAKHVHKGM